MRHRSVTTADLQTFVALSLVWHAAVPGVCGLGLGLARGGLAVRLKASAKRPKPGLPIIAPALSELKASGPKKSAAVIGSMKMCRMVFSFD